MFLVLRPHIYQFFAVISSFCNLYVYTHGEFNYAQILLSKYLDPQGAHFSIDRLCAAKGLAKSETKKSLST
jgi:hypothetical protein